MNPAIVTTLVTIGSLLTITSVIPYLIEIVKGTTKPRIVSWLIWCTLTGIATAASFSDKQYVTAIFLLFATITTFLVIVFGFKHGDRKFQLVDILCFVGAFVGIVLWQLFDSPALATIAVVVIDLLGGVPTLIHSFKKPHEETAITFFLCFIGATLALIAVSDWHITSVLYPIYLVLINFTFAVVIFFGQKRHTRINPSHS